jgi:hypothetical protein
MSKRLSLTLERADEDAVESVSHDSPERHALASLVDSEQAGSLQGEAAILRALVRVGASTVRERVLAQGYAEMADEHRQHDEERRALRQRRVARDAARG